MCSRGQTLIEIIVVITVGILVVGALTFAVLFSLRNAKFSQNQNQATKLTQEGLEKVRSIRNRDEVDKVIYNYAPGLNTRKFSDLWAISCSVACYFKFTNSTTVLSGSPTPEDIAGGFKRQVIIEEEIPASSDRKKVTVVVIFTDSTGEHESKITTFLGKI